MNKVMKEFLNTAIYLLCVLGAVWLVITFVGPVSYTHLTLPTSDLV